jgi:hypothetical protein
MFCDTKVDAIVNNSATSEVVVAKDVAMDAITVVNLPFDTTGQKKSDQNSELIDSTAPASSGSSVRDR